MGEGATIAGVEVGFAHQPLGQQQVVGVQLNVIIRHPVAHFLHHGPAVNQIGDRDQHAIGEDCMIGAEERVTRRLAGAESMHMHWVEIARARMRAAIDLAKADPAHRTQRAAAPLVSPVCGRAALART